MKADQRWYESVEQNQSRIGVFSDKYSMIMYGRLIDRMNACLVGLTRIQSIQNLKVGVRDLKTPRSKRPELFGRKLDDRYGPN